MRMTVADIRAMKARGEKIPMLTAYDYWSAKLVDAAGVPMLLVGDSLGMVVLGYDSTIPVTLEDMLHHTKAVVRGTRRALVVADMPFMSYSISQEEALRNAGRFLQDAGAQAVKVEGGGEVAPTVRRIISCGVPVMGHIGLTPQSLHQLGGFKVQGKTSQAALKLLEDAEALDDAGVFALVLESIPASLAKVITRRVSVPTIGIGAGVHCDGQVQVLHDILGLFIDFQPKHTKRYANLGDSISAAVKDYMEEVRSSTFPTEKESFTMDEKVLAELTDLS